MVRAPLSAIVIACLLPVSCTSASTHGLRSNSFNASNKNAIVVIASEANRREFYTLSFDSYNAEKEAFGSQQFSFNFLQENSGYVFANAEPGEYLLSRIVVDTNWNLCPYEQTVSVTIKPGTINFLGFHNSTIHRAQAAEIARSKGDESLDQFSYVYYVDHLVAATIRRGTPQDVYELQQYISETFPEISAPIIQSDVTEASYRRPAENRLFGLTCTGG